MKKKVNSEQAIFIIIYFNSMYIMNLFVVEFLLMQI